MGLRCIDEISASLSINVEVFESLVLCHATSSKSGPLAAQRPSAQGERGDLDCSIIVSTREVVCVYCSGELTPSIWRKDSHVAEWADRSGKWVSHRSLCF